ncbi:MAG: dihydropteroate synthase [Clostridia bacterium]|nr:dihydropteroate synthase [Clostridia bacterium]
MILIGEKLNSSIPSTRAILEARDAAAAAGLAAAQEEAGAEWLDLNAGMFAGEEEAVLSWLAQTAAGATKAGLVLDSPDPAVLAAVADLLPGRRLLLNSATLDPVRLEPLLDLALRTGAGLVVLPIRGRGLPETVPELEENGITAVETLRTAGLPDDRIYIDILVSAAAVDDTAPARALAFARRMRGRYPGIRLTGGISNVSYGLPGRRAVNAAFLSAAVQAGVDAPILDVLDSTLLHHLSAAVLIAGQDEYCAEYLRFYRSRPTGGSPS